MMHYCGHFLLCYSLREFLTTFQFYFYFHKELFSLEMGCNLCHKALILHTVLRGYQSS